MLVDLSLPAPLTAVSSEAIVRRATRDDVPAIAALLADDAIAADRGDAIDDLAPYRRAFDAIAASDRDEVVVIEAAGSVVATVQLTRIPGMSRRAATRLQVESVRVAETARGGGVGSALLAWIVEVAAQDVDADLVQLTSDARRDDAIRFYERAGFVASHVGLKREVD